MYSSCIFCTRQLGANEAVEAFPVGRRLAFDAGKGRLWAICPVCRGWNLSPLEERWEAVEACEKLFRETRARFSTENIGLARLSEGLELVRIGEPTRPEYAAWRYGERFRRRYRRNLWMGGAATLVSAGIYTVAPLLGVTSAALFGSQVLVFSHVHRQRRRMLARIPVEDSQVLEVQGKHGAGAVLYPTTDAGGWALSVAHREGSTILRGEPGIRAAALLLPLLNVAGGSRRQVRAAVERIEEAGSAQELFSRVARERIARTSRGTESIPLGEGETEGNLALEMAAQEETEREALEGELRFLESAWREAEEIASIADSLLVPDALRQALQQLRSRSG